MELEQQAQNASIELRTEGATPSGEFHVQRRSEMREGKGKTAKDERKTFSVGEGDGEAETLNGEVGGTTSRVLRRKAATPQRAANKGRGGKQARKEGKRLEKSTLEIAMATDEGNSCASGDGVHQVLV